VPDIETLVVTIGGALGIVITIAGWARWVWLKRVRPWAQGFLKELLPNGGSSLADTVLKIKELIENNHEEAIAQWKELHEADREIKAILDLDPLTRSKLAAKILAKLPPERQAAIRLLLEDDTKS
jgi:hypothetical protein